MIRERGKKKQEAKKEAAAKMVQQIKEQQKLDLPIRNITGNDLSHLSSSFPLENLISGKSDQLFSQKKEDRSRKLFERALSKTSSLLTKVEQAEGISASIAQVVIFHYMIR